MREVTMTDLVRRLDIARSTVFVSAIALDHGDTDLELLTATALKRAFEMMSEIYDELAAMSNRTRPRRRLTGKAAIILGAAETAGVVHG